MKKVLITILAGLLVFTLVSIVLAEEEDDIRGRREKWLEKVILGGLVEKAQAAPALQADPDHDPLDDIVGPGGENPYNIDGIDPEAIVGDLNGNGKIDGTINDGDVFLFLQSWQAKDGDPNYNPMADFNQDGHVNKYDEVVFYYACKRSADGNPLRWKDLSCDDVKFAYTMSKIQQAVRDNVYFIPTPVRQYDANFDITDDRRIDGLDVVWIRNLGARTPDHMFIKIYTKILSAVSDRMGLTSADAKFTDGLDVDDDGTITYKDFFLISAALLSRGGAAERGQLTNEDVNELLQRKDIEEKLRKAGYNGEKIVFFGHMAEEKENQNSGVPNQ